MAQYPYMTNPARVERFLEHIQSAGVPGKVTYRYLQGVGFKSSNDRRLVGILKFIGFLDDNGVPTPKWGQYRDRQTAKEVLASAIRDAYADLFNTYDDACQQDTEKLQNFFVGQTDRSQSTCGYMVGTFKRLCALADLEAVAEEPAEAPEVPERAPAAVVERPVTVTTPQAVPLSIALNIQIVLPATDDASIYDALFGALKKHLLS